jgi:peptidoglycan biosynthesis protein MviN/MurJ (putative lipid II flippase)
MLLVVLLLPPGMVPAPLIAGTVIGVALQTACLGLLMARHRELDRPRFRLQSSLWNEFGRGVALMTAGQILISITSLIDQFFAASMGPGALSALSYTNRIMTLVLGMGAMALSRAVLPVFSRAQARGGTDVRDLALKWAALMLAAGTVVVLVGELVSTMAVTILFERGAFSRADTLTVAGLLDYSLIQLPLYACSLTLGNLMASAKRYGVLFASGALGLALKIAAAFALVPVLQLKGLVLSGAVVYMGLSLLFLLVARAAPHGTR